MTGTGPSSTTCADPARNGEKSTRAVPNREGSILPSPVALRPNGFPRKPLSLADFVRIVNSVATLEQPRKGTHDERARLALDKSRKRRLKIERAANADHNELTPERLRGLEYLPVSSSNSTSLKGRKGRQLLSLAEPSESGARAACQGAPCLERSILSRCHLGG